MKKAKKVLTKKQKAERKAKRIERKNQVIPTGAENIKVGTVVTYSGEGQQGWMRVSRRTKHTVNLKSVFGKHIYHIGVPISTVKEDEAAWYAAWQQTDAYQCM